MRVSFLAGVATILVACSACGYRLQQPYYPASNASESIEVRVAQDQVEKVASQLREALLKGGRHGAGGITISTNADYYGRPQTIAADTDVYASALDDAHRKAAAIAAREHVSLGPVESIQEVLGGAGPPYSPLKGNMPPTLGIRVSANQPVTLYVAFRLGSPIQQSDVPQVISVYGLGTPQISPRYGAQGMPKVISIEINGGGRSAEAAIDALAQDDRLVRDTLAKMNVPASAISVARSSTYQQ
ncbi:MAG TPA: SIMPL domain-containing protein [Candidatus Eremiobacteraceae bacterium]|jgi:uncharacterized protein YggE|nr:SIMPL domain-containing protein [Candidatus Eremiobacteraceae bacterium]